MRLPNAERFWKDLMVLIIVDPENWTTG
jgi:hypothetical protein